MKPVREPNCAAHPDHELWLEIAGYGPAVWICATCRRRLGVESVPQWPFDRYAMLMCTNRRAYAVRRGTPASRAIRAWCLAQ